MTRPMPPLRPGRALEVELDPATAARIAAEAARTGQRLDELVAVLLAEGVALHAPRRRRRARAAGAAAHRSPCA